MSDLVAELKNEFQKNANSAYASDMAKYMRSRKPFYGIRSRKRQEIVKGVAGKHKLASVSVYYTVIRELFFGATHREEWYAAIDLAGHRLYRTFQNPDHVALYKEMAVEGAWWDIIDYISPRRLGPILKNYPDDMTPLMREWAQSDDIWIRRCAILCQLKFKKATDEALLFDTIRPSFGSSEFFLNKAIGWVLREYAKTAPNVVIGFVRENVTEMHPLSKREGLRRLLAEGVIDHIP